MIMNQKSGLKVCNFTRVGFTEEKEFKETVHIGEDHREGDVFIGEVYSMSDPKRPLHPSKYRIEGPLLLCSGKCKYKSYRISSKLEALFYVRLKKMVMDGELKDMKFQPKYPLIVNGVKICDYSPDFDVTHNDGRLETVEAKGIESDIYKVKKKLFEILYERKLTVLKAEDASREKILC